MASFETVEKLRERANVSFEDAREALEQSDDDMLDAVIYLEKKGKVPPPPTGGHFYSNYGGAGDHFNAGGHAYYHDSSRETENSGKREKTRKSGRTREKYAYYYDERDKRSETPGFFTTVSSFFAKAFRIGNNTLFEVSRKGEEIIKVPLTVAVIALIVLFKITAVLLILGLFFGFRYRISGKQFNDGPVNSAMDSVSNAADTIKDAFNKNFRN